MPRNGSDIYSIPPGTEGFPDTTIESEKYNNYIHDVETDLNTPRPISMGGTGATSADDALVSLHAEKAGQQINNFDSDPWMAGSFYSLVGATAPPVAGHAFSGIAHITNANNMVVEAVDLTDPFNTPWLRVKTAGVWGAWIPGSSYASIVCSDTVPANAPDNTLWFESDTGLLYIRYNDGDSIQWTIACPQPDISTYAIKADVNTSLALKADQTYVDARSTLYFQNSVVFDPPSLATSVAGVIQTLTVAGAAVGDFCLASFSSDLNGMTLLAWVSAADTTSFQFQNKTAGTIDLASGTVRVRVWKQ